MDVIIDGKTLVLNRVIVERYELKCATIERVIFGRKEKWEVKGGKLYTRYFETLEEAAKYVLHPGKDGMYRPLRRGETDIVPLYSHLRER